MRQRGSTGWSRAPAAALASLLLSASIAAGGEPAPEPARPRITSHVVLISIDGLRPEAIERYHMRTVERLMHEGSYSLSARTILPSTTLPSHASMLTGTPPDVHGLDFNHLIEDGPHVAVPTIFELARRAGLGTAAFFSKAKFRHLDRPGSFDYWQAPDASLEHWMASRTVGDAAEYLRQERPNLLFVHIGEPDYAGHTTGWMNVFYGWAVKRADKAVADLLGAADAAYGPGNYTVIITSDHGGHGREHGTDRPEDMTIPWIAWGNGVKRRQSLPEIRTTDTAATVLWLLGVPVPSRMVGRPVIAAFVVPAAIAEEGGDLRE